MDNNNVISIESRDFPIDSLTELLRSSATRILAHAVQIEVEGFLSHYDGQLTEDGRKAVVRSGYQRRRDIQTGVGPVSVRIRKGSFEYRRAGVVPLGADPPVCEKDRHARGVRAVAVFERHIKQ